MFYGFAIPLPPYTVIHKVYVQAGEKIPSYKIFNLILTL